MAEVIPGMADYRKEVTQAGEQEQAQAQALVDTTKAAGQQQVDLAERFASAQQPFDTPTPVDHINDVMAGAPWLFALAALGGAASKMNGMAMIQGLNGMSDGIIKGDQQALENGYQAYQASYEKWKARSDQQLHIYTVLADAYGRSTDANLRAMTAALNITKDVTERRLELDDPRSLVKLNSELKLANARTAEAYAKAQQIKEMGGFGGDTGMILAALSDLGVTLPSGLRGQQQMLGTIQGLRRTHPDDTPQEIAARVADAQMRRKVIGAEATLAGRKEAAVGGAIVTLNEPGGLYQQLDEAASKINFGDSKIRSRVRLAMQGGYVADKNIQGYVSTLQEARSELSQIFSRTGLTTDKAREMAEHALPESASLAELRTAIKASNRAALAVESGNRKFIESLRTGHTLEEALKEAPETTPRAATGGRKPLAIGQSPSTGQWFVKYDDGTIGPLGTVTPAQ